MTEDQYIEAINTIFPTATEDEVMRILLLIEQAYKEGFNDGYSDVMSTP
jgi:hypothetical protein